jgi:hypothetical protein
MMDIKKKRREALSHPGIKIKFCSETVFHLGFYFEHLRIFVLSISRYTSMPYTYDIFLYSRAEGGERGTGNIHGVCPRVVCFFGEYLRAIE